MRFVDRICGLNTALRGHLPKLALKSDEPRGRAWMTPTSRPASKAELSCRPEPEVTLTAADDAGFATAAFADESKRLSHRPPETSYLRLADSVPVLYRVASATFFSAGLRVSIHPPHHTPSQLSRRTSYTCCDSPTPPPSCAVLVLGDQRLAWLSNAAI